MSFRKPGASRRALAISASLVIAAMTCLSPAVAQNKDKLRPAGLKPLSTSPEAGLWTLSNAAEVDARQSAELNRDPELNAYVSGVACKVAASYCGEMRVYLMDRPFFNASMAPNGYMEVWSGLMLRAKNEAELAFVLGHEIGHFANSHTWQSFQDTKARADGAMIASLLISAAGVVAMANAGSTTSIQNISNATQGLVNAVYLGAVAGMFGYSRDNEREADTYGFNTTLTAAYNPGAGAALWQRMRAETAASDFQEVRKRDTRVSVFDSHPLVIERVQALEKLSAAHPNTGATEELRYRAAIRPHLSAWLKDDLRRRDFGQTLFVIDQLAATGEDLGVLNFYRGEAIRLRRSQGYQAAAEEFYRKAIGYPDAPAVAYRELGDLAEKRGDKNGMADLLIEYLQRDPTAKDAAFVKMRIEQIKPMPATAPPPPVEAPPAETTPAAEAPPAGETQPAAPIEPTPTPPAAKPPTSIQPPAAMTLVEPAQ